MTYLRIFQVFIVQSIILFLSFSTCIFFVLSIKAHIVRCICFFLSATLWSLMIGSIVDRSRCVLHLVLSLTIHFFLMLHVLPFWRVDYDAVICLLIFFVFGLPIPGRVPLFLTHHRDLEVLSSVLPLHKQRAFIDIGSGLGDVVLFFARASSKWTCRGYESAFLLYLLSTIRCRLTQSAAKVFCLDFYKGNLGKYNVIYAFLSSEHMLNLWEKIQEECSVGTWFISFRFNIPGAIPFRTIETEKNVFYIYVIS